ncbi:MAG: DUF368 domain-containing protein, partial [Marinirhabdus sp.]
MQPRTFLQNTVVVLKGMAMGAADVVPGVSGGTIAFISGIYEELVQTIDGLSPAALQVWKKESFATAWKKYNLTFLLCVFGGVVVSILSLAKLITFLLDAHPLPVWGFFFGLVLASIVYVGKQMTAHNIKTVVAVILAAAFSYYITVARPIGSPESTWFLFLAGFIAIIAMILPGISGAFILLLLGAYKPVMGVITNLSDGVANGDWPLVAGAVLKILVFGAGAILGLKVFSKALTWLFQHYKNTTLAILTGFMIGALNKIWPWKKVLEHRTASSGHEVPFIEKSILPAHYPEDPKILLVCVFAATGFMLIFLL